MQDRRGTILLGLARRELERHLGVSGSGEEVSGEEMPGTVREVPDTIDEPWLNEPGAIFVTLRKNGELRGCVGNLNAERPLIDTVKRNSVAAATRDPRFPAVTAEELSELTIEVSVLSAPEPLAVSSEADACERLRPGVDGVVFNWKDRQSTFLPQVWDSLPEPVDFLAQLKRKARLAVDFWDDDVRLEIYQVTKYVE